METRNQKKLQVEYDIYICWIIFQVIANFNIVKICLSSSFMPYSNITITANNKLLNLYKLNHFFFLFITFQVNY